MANGSCCTSIKINKSKYFFLKNCWSISDLLVYTFCFLSMCHFFLPPHFLTAGNQNATCQILKFAGASALSKSLSLSSHSEVCMSERSTKDDRHAIPLFSVFIAAQKHTAFARGPITCSLCNQDCRFSSRTCCSPDQSITSKATLCPQILCCYQASCGLVSNKKRTSNRYCERKVLSFGLKKKEHISEARWKRNGEKGHVLCATKSKSRKYQSTKSEN